MALECTKWLIEQKENIVGIFSENRGNSWGVKFNQKAKKIAKELGWKIVAEKAESRVTLIMKEDEDRYLFFPHDIQDKANQEIHKDKEEWEAIQEAKKSQEQQ